MSFNNLDDYAVYLHVTHGNEAGLQQALAAVMSIYPDLEFGYDVAINKAYQGELAQKRQLTRSVVLAKIIPAKIVMY